MSISNYIFVLYAQKHIIHQNINLCLISVWNYFWIKFHFGIPLQILIIKSWYIDFTNATINQCIWIYIKRSIFRCVFLQNKIPCVKFFNLTLFFRLIYDLSNEPDRLFMHYKSKFWWFCAKIQLELQVGCHSSGQVSQ